MTFLKKPVLSVLPFFILLGCATTQPRLTPPAPSTISLVSPASGVSPNDLQATGERVMIASEGELATQAGIEMIKQGGNAVDAAIAVSFAISVYSPHSTGIGGGGFMLIHLAKQKGTVVVDFRERAPLKATRDMYVKDGKVVDGLSIDGHLSVAVPGVVAGLVEVQQKYGQLTLADVMGPAIQLAEHGFKIYPRLASAIEQRKEVIQKNKAMTSVFLPNGTLLKEGDRLVQSDLAKTLTLIAKHGKAGFYEGPVANAIVKDMEVHHGLISHADLKLYKTKYRKPIMGRYRGYDVASMSPPSSGGIHIVQMLNMLEHFNLLKYPHLSAPYTHLMAEVMRRAYSDRAKHLGDPDYYKVPVKGLISKKYARDSLYKISLDRASVSKNVSAGDPAKYESPSTTHFSVIDSDGNAVSSTQTVNYLFGSCVMVPGTGIILNDEMDDFSASPGQPNVYGLIGGAANAIQYGKTPLSSMSPTLVFKNGEIFMAAGGSGGAQIITSVLHTLVNTIDYQLPLYEAVAAGRVHHQYFPDEVRFDEGVLSKKAINRLDRMGHTLNEKNLYGRVQVVVKRGKKLFGVSDPRSHGRPLGL